MAKRSRVPARKGKKHFSRTAKKVHPKNLRTKPMRGGIRL